MATSSHAGIKLLILGTCCLEASAQLQNPLQSPRNSSAAASRRTSATDGPLKLALSPSWVLSTGLNANAGTISGTILVQGVWASKFTSSTSGLDDPIGFVNVQNLIGGSSARVQSDVLSKGIPSYDDPTVDINLYWASILFVGAYKESVDDTCYPIEHKEVTFTIDLFQPGPRFMHVHLFCEQGGANGVPISNYAHPDEKDFLPYLFSDKFVESDQITECKLDMGNTVSSGVTWQSWSCVVSEPKAQIECTMYGTREPGIPLRTFVQPAIMFTLIGFASFGFSPKLAMPRVATTMIALLTLSNYKIKLMGVLSTTGEPILMKFYSGLITLIFICMCSHVLSIKFSSVQVGRVDCHAVIDHVLCFISPPLFFLAICCDLMVEGCTTIVSHEAYVALIIFAGLLVVLGFFVVFKLHKQMLWDYLKQEEADRLGNFVQKADVEAKLHSQPVVSADKVGVVGASDEELGVTDVPDEEVHLKLNDQQAQVKRTKQQTEAAAMDNAGMC